MALLVWPDKTAEVWPLETVAENGFTVDLVHVDAAAGRPTSRSDEYW